MKKMVSPSAIGTAGLTGGWLILGLVILISSFTGCEKATVIEYETGTILTDLDPIQESSPAKQPFTIENSEGIFTILPMAQYRISARVVGAKSYSSGWESSLSPIDLALVWGKLADRSIDQFISYSQRNRWYYYRYSQDTPVDNTYIINHSCNNHLIPAGENIRRALKTIDVNDLIRIHGHLVNIRGKAGRREVWWNTSTSRSDSGDHSCEIIYVEKIRINDKVYY